MRRHGRKGDAALLPGPETPAGPPGARRHRRGEYVVPPPGAPPRGDLGDDREEVARVGRVLLGPHAVAAALARGRRSLRAVYVPEGDLGERLREIVRAAERAAVPVSPVPRETLDTLARGRPHQGIVALAGEFPYLSLREFDRLLEESSGDFLVVVLDQIQDPQNLGAILRSCAAFGVDVVVIPERRAAGVTEAAVRASAGASEMVSVARVPNLAEVLRRCRDRGLDVVAVDPGGGERVAEAGLNPPLALVFGAEGPGLRRLTRERAGRSVRIRITGTLGSLNVSVSVGIVLHQIRNASPDPGVEAGDGPDCTPDPR